ncbi:MAG: aspartate aminotransferase family protein [Ilumatobacteraceae bacterium]
MAGHAFLEHDRAKALLAGRESGVGCPFMPVFGPPQVMFVRGEGTRLWDDSGKEYLDFLCGLAVTSLGHAHPAVAKAIAEQASVLLHVSNFFANPVATEVAIAIDALHGAGGQVFFCNSGAEANEAAFKIARKFGGRGRHVVVSALGSFHGRTLAALAATGQPEKHEPFQPMPEGFHHVPFGDIAALAAVLQPSVGAVIIETIQGEGGVVPASVEYLREVERLCREHGALLIVDEVQTGFARTGEWFGYQAAGLTPDIVTMAKGLGNGMPIGAVWAKRQVAGVMKPGDHGSTFSGTAIATAAARAVITTMLEIDAPRLARERGAELRAGLLALPGVVAVHGAGLLLAAEIAPGLDSKRIAGELLARGLVVNAVTPTRLRLAPPLTVSSSEIDQALATMGSVLA